MITAVRCSTLRCSLFFSHEKYSKQKLNGRQNIYDMTFRFVLVLADKNSRVCWHVKSGIFWSSHLFSMHVSLQHGMTGGRDPKLRSLMMLSR